MSKERLEEILELHEKAVVAYEDCDFLEMRKHIETLFLEEFTDWLIQQAERVQELEELIEDYKTVNKELHDRRKKLRKQNKRYREALERQFGEFWEACVKVVGEDMAYDIVAEMPEEGEE